jgi:hypothetical protein
MLKRQYNFSLIDLYLKSTPWQTPSELTLNSWTTNYEGLFFTVKYDRQLKVRVWLFPGGADVFPLRFYLLG